MKKHKSYSSGFVLLLALVACCCVFVFTLVRQLQLDAESRAEFGYAGYAYPDPKAEVSEDKVPKDRVRYRIDRDARTITVTGTGALPDFNYDLLFPPIFYYGYTMVITEDIVCPESFFRSFYGKRAVFPHRGSLEGGFTYLIDDSEKTVTILGDGILSDPTLGHILTPEQQAYTLVLDGRITGISDFDYCRSVRFGPNVFDIEDNIFRTGWEKFEVSEDNYHYADYHGCLYTKDYAELLRYPPDKAPNDFHPNLQRIGSRAFSGYKGFTETEDTLVIPWGVTSIGISAFDFSKQGKYVIPDTAIRLEAPSCGFYDEKSPENSLFPYWLPSRNNPTAWEKWRGYLGKKCSGNPSPAWKKWEKNYLDQPIERISHNRIASYYGLQPNSFKTAATGKLYYIDENYRMAHGWTQVDGDWYYFNDYGAAAVKCWMEKDGNKYFLQADGTMAKNKWINWDSTWYYVGPDGIMYRNRYTPDGYWVNAAGICV